jgi:hypothetical protein
MPVTPNCVLRDATRLIAQTYYGDRGTRAYDLFEAINRLYFAGELPWPQIIWALTAHGHCLGLTSAQGAPIITLHPSLLRGREKPNPWKIQPAWLGWRYAVDVLLHECIHVAVAHCYGGSTGPTSHNCPEWIAEVNRLAPMLGLPITATMSRSRRVRDADGTSHVVRRCDGSVSFRAISTFPHGVRLELGTAAAYYTGCNRELDVTESLRAFGVGDADART